MSQTNDAGARASVVRAALRVGTVETEYLRVGSGTPVIVLEPSLASLVRDGVVPVRWRAHRLLVPLHTTIEALASRTAPEAGAPFNLWLRGLIDGLGVTEVTIVVSPALETDVRRFAAAHPTEVALVDVTAPQESTEAP